MSFRGLKDKYFTARNVRRLIILIILFLLGAGISAYFLTRPNIKKQQTLVVDPTKPNKIFDNHYNDISLDDIENLDDFIEPQVIDNKESESTGGGSESHDSGETKLPGSIEVIPGHLLETYEDFDINKTYTLITSEGESSTGTMMYYISTVDTLPSKEYFKEFSDLDNVVNNVGKYSIYYYSKGDATHYDTQVTLLHTFEIVGPQGSIEAVPSIITSLEFNNDYQNIITNPGSSSTGTIMFAYSKIYGSSPDKSEFVTALDFNLKDVGTYYIYYYSKGNLGYADTVITYLEACTIAQSSAIVLSVPTGKSISYIANVTQALIKGASAEKGIPMYALGTISGPTEDYQPTIPYAEVPGTYYIWWYVDGGEIYISTTPSYITSTIGAAVLPKANCNPPTTNYGITADGTNQQLVSAGSSNNGTMMYCLGSSNNPGTNWTSNVTQITGKEPGTYYVWYYAKGNGNTTTDSDYGKKIVTIYEASKKAYVVNTPEAISPLYYIGSNQNLVIPGSGYPGGMKYIVSNTLTCPDKSLFTSDGYKAKNNGTYYVWYYAEGDGVEYGDSDVCVTPIEVVIDKQQAIIKNEPQAFSSLVYGQEGFSFGEANKVTLCRPGEVLSNSGTMMYATTTTLNEPPAYQYTQDLPKEKDAGTYYVWYYIKASDGYADTNPSFFEASIDKAISEVINKPTFVQGSLNYTGSPVQIVNNSSALCDGGEFAYYVVPANTQMSIEEFENFKGFFKEDNDDHSSISVNNSGDYMVYYYVKGDSNHYDSDLFTVKKSGDPSVETVTVSGDNDDIVLYPPLPVNLPTDEYNDLVYPVDLLKVYPNDDAFPEFLRGTYGTAWSSNSDEYYYMHFAATTTPEQPDKSEFNYIAPQTYEPGTYYVWYYGLCSDHPERDTDIGVVISVVRDIPKVVREPSLKITRATISLGETISPVSAGVVDGGIMMYYLEPRNNGGIMLQQTTAPDKSLFSVNIPIVNESGEYDLWYYVKGDDKHIDIGPYKVTNDLVFLAVKLQANITIHPEFKEGIEDGTYQYILSDDYSFNDNPILAADGYSDMGSQGHFNYFIVSDANDLNLSDDDLIDRYYDNIISVRSDTRPPVSLDEVIINRPGSYTLCYYAESNDFDSPYEKSKLEKVPFIINKPKTVFIEGKEPKLIGDSVDYEGYKINIIKDSPISLNPDMGEIYYAYVKRTENDGPIPNVPDLSLFTNAYECRVGDVGTYYVWAIVDETALGAKSDPYYVGKIEIKPIGGYNPVSFTDPTPATGLIYDESSHSLINLGFVDEEQGVFKYFISRSFDPDAMPIKGMFTTDAPLATDAGTYYVSYYVEGKEGYDDSSVYTFPVEIGKASQSMNSLAVPSSFSQDGLAHYLISEQPTSTGNTTPEYFVSTSGAEPTNDTIWASIEATKQSLPGRYYIWYRCKEQGNYAATPYEYTIATIRAKGSIDVEPTFINHISISRDVTYIGNTKINGSAGYAYQDEDFTPITQASSVTGEMRYCLISVNEYGENYVPDKSLIIDETVPTVKEPGSYYIFYYAKSLNGLSDDSDIEGVKITINAKQASFISAPSINNATKNVSDSGLTTYTLAYSPTDLISMSKGSNESGVEMRYAMWNSENEDIYMNDPVFFKDYDTFMETYLNIPLNPGTYYIGYYLSTLDPNKAIPKNYTFDEKGVLVLEVTKGHQVITPPVYDEVINNPTRSIKELLIQGAVAASGDTVYYCTSTGGSTQYPVKPDESVIDDYNIPRAKDAGEYYIWYMTKENDYYFASEPAWVRVKIDGSYTPPTISPVSRSYDAQNTYVFAHPLAIVDNNPDNFKIHFAFDEAMPTFIPPNYDSQWWSYVYDGTNSSLPQAAKSGTYAISYYYEINSEDNIYSDIHTIYSTIGYCGICWVSGGHVMNAYIGGVVDNPYWNGYAFSTPPYTYNYEWVYGTDPYLYYYYHTTDPDYVPDKSEYQRLYSNVPISGTGKHYVWWYGEDVGIYLSGKPQYYVAPSGPNRVVLTVLKGKPLVGEKPKAAGTVMMPLRYTGEPINLIVPGTISDYRDEPYRGEEIHYKYYVQDDSIGSVPDKSLFSYAMPTATLPGTYKVYWYLEGNEYFEESGINYEVVTIEQLNDEFNDLSSTYSLYNPNGINLVYFDEGSLCKDPSLNNKYRAMYAIGDPNVAPTLASYTPNIPKATMPGTYYVWWYVENVNGNIMVQEPRRCSPSIIEKGLSNIDSLDFITIGYYEGEDVDLLNTNPTTDPETLAKLDGRELEYCAVYSKYGDGLDIEPDNSLFTSTLPKASAIGYYVVWYRTKESDKYLPSEKGHSSVIHIDLSLDTVIPTGYSKKGANTLSYNGEEQSLLKTQGTSSSGTFYYTSGIPFGDDGPSDSDFIYTNANPPKQSSAGSYEVYYRIQYSNGDYSEVNNFKSHIVSLPSQMYSPLVIKGDEVTRPVSIPDEDGVYHDVDSPVHEFQFEESPIPFVFTPAQGDKTGTITPDNKADDGVIAYFMSNRVLRDEELLSIFSGIISMKQLRILDSDKDFLLNTDTSGGQEVGPMVSFVRSQIIKNIPGIDRNTPYEELSPELQAVVDSQFATAASDFDDIFVDVNSLTIRQPGTYAVYSVLVPNDYWKQIGKKVTQYCPYDPTTIEAVDCQYVSAVKVPCTITVHPQVADANTLFYNNGNPIPLLKSGGEVENGSEILYYVSRTKYTGDAMQALADSNNGISWMSYYNDPSIPGGMPTVTVCGTNAGKYYVYYFGWGSGNYDDSQVYCLEVEIKGEAPIITAPSINPVYEYTYKVEESLDGDQIIVGTIPFAAQERADSNPEIALSMSERGSATYQGEIGTPYYLITWYDTTYVDPENDFGDPRSVKVDDLVLMANNELFPGDYRLWYTFRFNIDDEEMFTAPEFVEFKIKKASLHFAEGAGIELLPEESRFINEELNVSTMNNYINTYHRTDCIIGGKTMFYLEKEYDPANFYSIVEYGNAPFVNGPDSLSEGVPWNDRDLYYRLWYCFVPDIESDIYNENRFEYSSLNKIDYTIKYIRPYATPDSLVLPHIMDGPIYSNGTVIYPFVGGEPEAGWEFRYYFTKDSTSLLDIYGNSQKGITNILEQFEPINEVKGQGGVVDPGLYYAYVLAFNKNSIQRHEDFNEPYIVYPNNGNNRNVPLLTQNICLVQKGKLEFLVEPECIEDTTYDPMEMSSEINILKPGTAIANGDSSIEVRYYVVQVGEELPSKEDMINNSRLINEYDPEIGVYIPYAPGEYYVYFMLTFNDPEYYSTADPLDPYIAFKYTIKKVDFSINGDIKVVDNPQPNSFLIDKDNSTFSTYPNFPLFPIGEEMVLGEVRYSITNINSAPELSTFDTYNDTLGEYWPSVEEPGQYYLWYYIKSLRTNLLNDSEVMCIPFTVLGDTGYIVPDIYDEIVEYDGNAHSVIRSPFKVFNKNGVEITDGSVSVVYGITASADSLPVSYSSNINDGNLSIRASGNHYLHYKAIQDGGDYISDQWIRFTVLPEFVPFTAPSASEDLNIGIDNQPVKLLSEGACNVSGSSFIYYVTCFEDDCPTTLSAYSDDTSVLWVNEPGHYYVWYVCRCQPSSGYRSSKPAVIEVDVTKSQVEFNGVSPKGVVVNRNALALGRTANAVTPGYHDGWRYEYILVHEAPDNAYAAARILDGELVFSDVIPTFDENYEYGLYTVYWRKVNITSGESSAISNVISNLVSEDNYIDRAPIIKDSFTFTGNDEELIDTSYEYNNSLRFAISEEFIEGGPSEDMYSPDIPTARRPGTYYVWYKMIKPTMDDYEVTDPLYGIVNIYPIGNVSFVGELVLKFNEFTLELDGDEQVIPLAFEELIDTEPDLINGTMLGYAVVKSYEECPNISSFNSKDNIAITEPGDYKVYYCGGADPNSGFAFTEIRCVEMTVNSAAGMKASIDVFPMFNGSIGTKDQDDFVENPVILVVKPETKAMLLDINNAPIALNGIVKYYLQQSIRKADLPTVAPDKSLFTPLTSSLFVTANGISEYGVLYYYVEGAGGAEDSDIYTTTIFSIEYQEGAPR